ncbi:NAD-dependent epimerase/dehydratase family protein [Kutzneria sp. CA-103260]|uniref:NAD-dependent epimerase/dehydratase family protein n=1 Tax=Kutzneria sp. CA-103260 TaxID=2802641 RepID=UPI001BABD5BF|nr:NAD-dependent epimerase/dehydratase family protein [Kutzneria sp. CA-103260]QUQ62699.1 oxidoreductase [Kutzneria sp. CA-103260]
MRVLVTGASGHIGSAVLPELRQAGHEVVGLVRSDASAEVVAHLGAEVVRGDLADLDGLRRAAAAVDAVIHLAFDHSNVAPTAFVEATNADHAVVRAFGDALAGTGKTFIGVGVAPTGDPERDAVITANPRSAVASTVVGLNERDVRAILVAVPPVTHSSKDRHGFLPRMIGIARRTGVSGYVGEGANRWPAAHTLDVGRLFALALDKAPGGSQLVAAAEEGVPVREIAEAIGQHLGIPAASVPAEHFQEFPFIGLDIAMPNAETRALLGWDPVHPGLIADLARYF